MLFKNLKFLIFDFQIGQSLLSYDVLDTKDSSLDCKQVILTV